jgi:hypothetical protein
MNLVTHEVIERMVRFAPPLFCCPNIERQQTRGYPHGGWQCDQTAIWEDVLELETQIVAVSRWNASCHDPLDLGRQTVPVKSLEKGEFHLYARSSTGYAKARDMRNAVPLELAR